MPATEREREREWMDRGIENGWTEREKKKKRKWKRHSSSAADHLSVGTSVITWSY